jgi:hypothetical protein
MDGSLISAAQTGRRCDQRIKHGLEIEGRAANDLEHVGSGGLLLQRFAQLVEEAGILDGDDGLTGEAGQQLDLLFAERAHLGAVDGNGPDHIVVLQHRDAEQSAHASDFHRGARQQLTVQVGSVFPHVGNVDGHAGVSDAGQRNVRGRLV